MKLVKNPEFRDDDSRIIIANLLLGS